MKILQKEQTAIEKKRINAFSSGIKKLSYDSRNYIQELTQILFLIEQPPVYPISDKKSIKRKNTRMSCL